MVVVFTRKVVNNGTTTIATIVRETIVRRNELDQYLGERSIVRIVLAPSLRTSLELLCSESPIDINIVSYYRGILGMYRLVLQSLLLPFRTIPTNAGICYSPGA